MLTEIKDLICDGFAKVPEITKNFIAGCKQLSFSKLLGEAKQNCSGISDATKKGKAVHANIKMAQANIVKFVKTMVSNASQPLMAVMSGFREALKAIQEKVFANVPASEGKGCLPTGGFPSFSKAQADGLDANGSMTELPRLGVQETGVKEVDAVFSGVKNLFDTLVDANNSIIEKAKAIPGAEDGSGLRDAIASAAYNGQDSMEQKKPLLCFFGGGPPMPKVDASWDKLKKGDVKMELPKFDLDKLSASHRVAIEKLMELAQAAIDIIKKTFKQACAKFKELVAAIKKLTPSKVKALAKKELENAAEIPHKAMLCAENVKIADFMARVMACFFATFTSIAKAIMEGFEQGRKAMKAKVAPNSKAPATAL